MTEDTLIDLYTRDNCAFCTRAKALLAAKNVTWREIDITGNDRLKADMIARSGRQTVPQIFIGGTHVGGYDDLAALDAAGALDPLLGIASKEAEEQHERLIILGTGPAGYTAALYAARAGLDPLLVTGLAVGGQLTTTTDVENWPGGEADLQGPELMDRFQDQVDRLGVRQVAEHIDTVDLSERPFQLQRQRGRYVSDALIVATGAAARWLGLPSEDAYKGRGVSACATCDGPFFKNRGVAVVGGGNTAVEEALFLAGIASHVTLIHRGITLKAEKVLQDRLFAQRDAGRIDVIFEAEVTEVVGDGQVVTSVKMTLADGATSDLNVDGLFVAIGHDPSTALLGDMIERANGYLVTKGGRSGEATATSVPGVFAAGDVADPIYRQAVTSAASGAMAALDAERFLTAA